jgi:hypothetical protein
MYNIEEGPSYSILPLQNIHLRSGKVLPKDSPVIIEKQIEQEEIPSTEKLSIDNQIQKGKTLNIQTPPFPERLVKEKLPISLPEFDVLDELRNVCVKIPLLQAIKDIPIYTKEIKELCSKKTNKIRKDPPTIHVIGNLAGLMSNTISIEKYVDPGIPMVTITINNFSISKTLIDLGAAINVMTLEMMRHLNLQNLRPTTTVLELADRSKVVPEGILEDITVSLDSWEYPVDFLVLQPKSNLGGHPLILGRPWLATTDAFIGCRTGNMIISHGTERKQITLYPPAQKPSVIDQLPWLDETKQQQEEVIQPILSINQAFDFREENNEDLLDYFISEPDISEELRDTKYIAADEILGQTFQENCTIHSLESTFNDIFPVISMENTQSKIIEISPGKYLNIGTNFEPSQEEQLIALLKKYHKAFAWEYTDMQGIHPETCTHHIYTDDNIRPLRQPQRRMNPILKEVVKEELQKLLKVGFIYPISDSQWVSPLVVVPKKNGKWRICVDYRELNKETLRDHFPLPFIDQVLDSLAGKNTFPS